MLPYGLRHCGLVHHCMYKLEDSLVPHNGLKALLQRAVKMEERCKARDMDIVRLKCQADLIPLQ